MTAFAIRYGLFLSGAVGLYGAVLVVGREWILRHVLGPQFVQFESIVLPLSLGLLATAWSLSGSVALRSVRAGKSLARAELVGSSARIAAVWVLLQRYGLAGAAWGVTIGSVLHASAMWMMYRDVIRKVARRPALTEESGDSRGAPNQLTSAGPDDRGSTAWPDFYLVGAPKCGTSAMYDYLRQHPDIYLPEKKELIYFGSDLSYRTRLSSAELNQHFMARRREQRIGMAHTAYLQSRLAATEIKSVRPDALILVMLRNPVEMLYSWHSELLYEAIEDIADFELALAAEPDRRKGRRVPENALNSYVEALFYTDVASYTDQVQRYFETFGRDRVHVVLQEDFLASPTDSYRLTLEFLGVEPSFLPSLNLVNSNKRVRSRAVQQKLFHSGASARRVARTLLPRSLRRRIIELNTSVEERPSMSTDTRRRLAGLFTCEIERLSELLDRDLSAWTKAPYELGL